MSDEINRYIHEEILGKCWHALNYAKNHCSKCNQRYGGLVDWKAPDYCSEDSPRSLLNEAVLKVHPAGGYCGCQYGQNGFCDMQIDTPAAEIARACVVVHKDSVESSTTPSDTTETP